MHDARHAYDPDTVVVDIEQPSSSPLRSRTTTDGALTMHVLAHGRWHRRTPDLKTTGCGQPYHAQFAPVRRESYEGPLCQGPKGDGVGSCFTPFEHGRSVELAKADKKGT